MNESDKVLSQKRAYCVSLTGKGITKKLECDDVSEVLHLLDEDALQWMDFSVENLKEDSILIATSLKFSLQLLASVLSNRYSAYEDLDVELGLMLPAVRVEKFDVNVHQLLVLVRKNLIVTIHPKEINRLQKIYRYADTYMKKIRHDLPWMDRLTILVTRIIDENNEKNFNGLRIIEEEGDELNKYMTDLKASRVKIGDDIYKMKHALITYLNTLWASWDVINSLRYGDAEIISDNQKLLQRIGILGDDISRQIALSEHMSEVLASGLAVLQTIYNNQLQILNNRLAFVATWLAVLGTAVLVPNTLATVFGMNDTFMKYWNLTIPMLILSTIASGAFIYWILKKRNIIPPKID